MIFFSLWPPQTLRLPQNRHFKTAAGTFFFAFGPLSKGMTPGRSHALISDGALRLFRPFGLNTPSQPAYLPGQIRQACRAIAPQGNTRGRRGYVRAGGLRAYAALFLFDGMID